MRSGRGILIYSAGQGLNTIFTICIRTEYARANGIDPDETLQNAFHQGLHCLTLIQHFYTPHWVVNCTCSNFRVSMVRSSGVRILRVNMISLLLLEQFELGLHHLLRPVWRVRISMLTAYRTWNNNCWFFYTFFLPETRAWHFMRIIFKGNPHELLSPCLGKILLIWLLLIFLLQHAELSLASFSWRQICIFFLFRK